MDDEAEMTNLEIDEELRTWIDESLAAAVKALGDEGLFDTVMVEARPAWALPHRILIGQLRDPATRSGFYWFIHGEVPTDCLPSTVASTPRDVARHFSLKWQLDAARSNNGDALAEQAEFLYALADDSELWFEGAKPAEDFDQAD